MDSTSLQPSSVWKIFEELCAVPRQSHNETAIMRMLTDRERTAGFEVEATPDYLVVRKPASPGYEQSPGVVLQAHVDMVAQKVDGSSHDFSKDAITTRMAQDDPDWMMADGTTLGADDGIGVAIALALLGDTTLVHGPLEVLLTTNEEDGMSGAMAVSSGVIKGKYLLNIDGEDETELTIGCAGSIRTAARLSTQAMPAGGLVWFDVGVHGLAGGHSGVDIDKGRGNAALLLMRMLAEAGPHWQLASFSSGTAPNAIPRDAVALVGVAPDTSSRFSEKFMAAAATIRSELSRNDPGFRATLDPARPPVATDGLTGTEPTQVGHAAKPSVLASGASAGLAALFGGIPDGLIQMEPDMPSVVRTSLNLGKLYAGVEDGQFVVTTLDMVRSSVDAEKERLAGKVEAHLESACGAGWSVSQKRLATTPAWAPDSGSALLALAKTVYRELRGQDPKVLSTHGGLETGLFRPVYPHLDMLSLGATIRAMHSPDERVNVPSVARTWEFVRKLVERLR